MIWIYIYKTFSMCFKMYNDHLGSCKFICIIENFQHKCDIWLVNTNSWCKFIATHQIYKWLLKILYLFLIVTMALYNIQQNWQCNCLIHVDWSTIYTWVCNLATSCFIFNNDTLTTRPCGGGWGMGRLTICRLSPGLGTSIRLFIGPAMSGTKHYI